MAVAASEPDGSGGALTSAEKAGTVGDAVRWYEDVRGKAGGLRKFIVPM
jgi:hypothetical protein